MSSKLKIPETLEDLTPSWITDALRSAGVIANGRVDAIRIEVIGVDEGFSSTLARLRLEYAAGSDPGPTTLIAKMPSVDRKMRAWVQLYQGYEREIRFFKELAANSSLRTSRCLYAEMDESSDDLIRTKNRRLAQSMPGWLQAMLIPIARWYSGLHKGRYLLLLEDLNTKRLGDQVVGADFEEAALVARSLAKLHADFWEQPILSAAGWLPHRIGAATGVRSNYRRNHKNFCNSALATPPPEFIELMGWVDQNLEEILKPLSERQNTLLHGDCGLDNIFFEGEAVWLIDWQAVSIGPGVLDWAYFVLGCLHLEVEQQDELVLLKSYHRELRAHGVTGYDYSACLRDYHLAKLFLAITMVGWPDWYGPKTERLSALLLERQRRLFARLPDIQWGEFLSQPI